ncbi:MAG: M56 family metallopeptidase [Lachnospiraceae bacterium]|nr:M56 family metallopeptidase [Lachnospiraceae bacterium]
MMEKAGGIFLSFLQRNGIVAVVILAVLAVRMFLRKCPKKYSYGLWGIVGIRMIFDLPIASRFSLFNLVRLVKRKSQLTKIVHRTGLPGMHAQPVTKQVTQAAAGSHVTDQAAHTAAGLTAALTTSQKICALLFFVWLTGMLLFLAYGIYSYIKCRKMVQTAVLLTSAKQMAGSIRRKVKIWECDRIPSPFVLGIFRPQIYIPFRMEKKEQQYTLAHESWHIRRYDHTRLGGIFSSSQFYPLLSNFLFFHSLTRTFLTPPRNRQNFSRFPQKIFRRFKIPGIRHRNQNEKQLRPKNLKKSGFRTK